VPSNIHTYIFGVSAAACVYDDVVKKEKRRRRWESESFVAFFCFSIFSLCFYTFPFPLNIL
jgi:hypothetical protein